MSDKGKVEQLRAELAQVRVNSADSITVRQSLMRLVEKCDAELTDACDARDALARECNNARKSSQLWFDRQALRHELAQVRAELTDACAARDALEDERDRARNELATIDEALGEFCYPDSEDHGVYALCQSLDRARHEVTCGPIETEQRLQAELKDLQGANKSLGQHVTDVKKNRDYWYDKAADAEAERDKIRKEAQEQSDKVQRNWLSPCQKAGLEGRVKTLRGRLERVEGAADYWLKEYEELETDLAAGRGAVAKATKALERAATTQAAIVEAAEALAKATGKVHVDSALREELAAARDNMNNALEHKSKAASKLLERLATLDTAEKALATELAVNAKMLAHQCDLAREVEIGAMDLRRQLAGMEAGRDYWRKRCKHDTKTLDAAEKALEDCGSRGIYTNFDGPADAIMQMAARIEKLEDEPMIEVEITGQEMVEALQAERQLRREVERVCEAMSEMARNRGERLEEAEQRAETAEAALTDAYTLSNSLRLVIDSAHDALDKYGIKSGCPAGIATRIRWLIERTKRAEALAQPVTLEVAALLAWLADRAMETALDVASHYGTDHPLAIEQIRRIEAARNLAAQIREALDDGQA